MPAIRIQFQWLAPAIVNVMSGANKDTRLHGVSGLADIFASTPWVHDVDSSP